MYEDADISEVLSWLEERRRNCNVYTSEIPVKDLDGWHTDETTGNIFHKSNRFFTVIGVRISGANREVQAWEQPMIKQNECGLLGILCQERQAEMKYLLYAKYEPGNLHKIQLSPTVQATRSNLDLAHGGKRPRFAEYFMENTKGKVLVSVSSVEDGGRFYLKTNRNMMVELPLEEKLDIPDDYIWVTLPQFKKLLRQDNIVNSLARSVMGSM